MPSDILGSVTRETQFRVSLAQSEADVLDAQRLRYRVFSEELGACLPGPAGIDRDFFDPFCDHLLVRNSRTDEVVGTYRMLPALQAEKIGGFYAETEFDLGRMFPLSPRLVEVGRSCVHPEYRHGAVIALLWAGIIEYMHARGYEYLIGCASIRAYDDGGWSAAHLYRRLKADHLSPEEWRVFPKRRLALRPIPIFHEEDVAPPPLVKGYLRLGSYICGDPAWDPDFKTVDLLMLLPISRMNPRYARHFLRK